MDGFDWDGLLCESIREMVCQCGKGYCQQHGTHHMTDEYETLELDRRAASTLQGTRGGQRVIRKKIGEGY